MSNRREARLAGITGSEPVIGSVGLDPSLPKWARNFYPGGPEAGRRRRGFRVAAEVVTSGNAYAMDAFEYPLTSQLWRFYKHNTTLYSDDGTTISSASTGWNAPFPAMFFGLPRIAACVAWNINRRRVLREASAGVLAVEDFDLIAPATAGVGVASSATAGSLVAGNVYTYYFVNYNPNTGRQSGPIGPYSVTIAAGQSSATVTPPAASSDTQFTQVKTYRTQANLNTPYLQGTTAAGGGAFNDGVADAALTFSDPLPVSAFGDYFVGIPPGTTNVGFIGYSYKGMILSGAYKGNLYHTEPGSDDRWSANYRIPLDISGFDVTAIAETDDALIVATDKEIFAITGTGTYTAAGGTFVSDWQITKMSSEYGVFNSKCLLAVGGQVFGLGAGGVFTLDAGGIRPMKWAVRPDRIMSASQWFSASALGSNVACLGYDPLRKNLWASITLNGTVNNTQAPKQVTAVYPINETGKVGIYDMQISSYPQNLMSQSFINGTAPYGDGFFACDSYGNLLQLEYGENDGDGDQTAYTVATVGGGTPSTSATITASGMGAGQLPGRGTRVVGLPSDYTLDPVVGTVTTNNGSDTFTIADWGAAAAVGTTFFIGGILGWYETGGIVWSGASDGGLAAFATKQMRLYLQDLLYDESDALTASNYPHVYAQMKVDHGSWGQRVLVYDGTTQPYYGKAFPLSGKSESGGSSQGGTVFRFRFLAVRADSPARFFAYEPEIGDPGLPSGQR